VKETFESYETLWEPALSAGASVAWSDVYAPTAGYGPGAEGYAHHYLVALGDNVNGKFMRQFVFAAASGQEDNYSPKTGGVWSRVSMAALHTVYRSPDISNWKLTWKTLNWSGIPASFATAGLSNAYQPAPQQTFSATFERAGLSTAGYAGGNVLTAFVSAIRKKHPMLSIALRNRYSHTSSPE
jgi:hypothetical protein